MSEHLTVDELAELDAGVLAGRRRGTAERHLAGCEACAAKAEALGKTRETLRNLGPVQMPPEVAARLGRALRNASATSAGDIVPDITVARARRLRAMPRWAYGAAAAVVVLAGVAIGVSTLHRHHSPSVAASPVRSPLVATASTPPRFVEQTSGRTYTPTSVTTLAPALAAGESPADALSQGGAAGAAPGFASAGSGSATVRHPTSKAAAPRPAAAAPLAPPLPAQLQRLADSRSALLRCAAYITDTANAAPLAVDFGRWTNARAHLHDVPAMVLVFADPNVSNRLDVYVVAAACDENSLLDYVVVDK